MAVLDLSRAPHGGQQHHLTEWRSGPRITPTAIIDHSIVGSGRGAWQLFQERSNLESHFIVWGAGDPVPGFIEQLVDTDFQADANLDANDYGISIETGDLGNPDVQPWVIEQLESLIWLHHELRRIHPTIPNRRSRSCSDPGGHGYHTMHGAPSCWTPVSKTCPGTIRKKQWNDILLPAYLSGGSTTMEVTGFDDASTADLRQQALLGSQDTLRTAVAGNKDLPAGPYFRGLDRKLDQTLTGIQEIKTAIALITSAGVDVDALAAALLPALTQSPEFMAAIAKAVCDEDARRMTG